MKKFLVMAVFGLAGLAAFAGTCVVTHISLVSTDGTHDTFAGQLDNTSGVNILQHNFLVAFIDGSNNLVETKSVPGCLRSVQNNNSDFFSAVSTNAASGINVGLARIAFDSTFRVGTTSSQNVSITDVAANRNTTTLTVAGKVTNNASDTLFSPGVCIVVRTSAGNVLITATSSLSNIAAAGNRTFSTTITVPNDSTASTVDIWVDGLDSSNNPTTPQQHTGTSVTTGTATPTNTPAGTATPTATATPSAPGPAVKLGFTTQPSASSAEGAAFAAQPVVKVQDANGNTVTSDNTTQIILVTAPGTGFSGGGNVTCAAMPVTAVNGVASFAGCKVDMSGIGYQIWAIPSSVLNFGTSNAFDITPVGVASSLEFTQQPGDSTGGIALSSQPVVTVRSLAGGLFWTGTGSAGNVTLAMGANPGSGTLTCTAATVAAANGFAAFAGCKIDKIGTGYTVTAALANPVIPATASTTFDITLGAAAKLAFTTQPSASTANATSMGANLPVVTIQDAGGNTVNSTANVTIQITTPPPAAGVLTCTSTLTVAAVAGVATFNACQVSLAGVGYTLTAISTSLTSAVSSAFTIT